MAKYKLLFAVLLLVVTNSEAHDDLRNISPYWSGMIHLLISPTSIAALVGYLACIAESKKILDLYSILICAIVAGLASYFHGSAPEYFPSIGVLFAGIAAMLTLKIPQLMLRLAGIYMGIIVGVSSNLDQQDALSSTGVMTITLYLELVFLGLWEIGTANDRLKPIMSVGLCVIGSWITAFGILMTAVEIRSNLLN